MITSPAMVSVASVTLMTGLLASSEQITPGRHAEVLEEVLPADYRLSRAQVDGLWLTWDTKDKKGLPRKRDGEFWRLTLIESDTRSRAARGLAKSETEASIEAFEQLKKRRGHRRSSPCSISDGWDGHAEALVGVWGEVPKYRGRGRPPTKKRPRADWQHLRMVKQHRQGRVSVVEARPVHEEEREARELHERPVGQDDIGLLQGA